MIDSSSCCALTDSLADEVMSQPETHFATLDQVGMRGIEMPVRVRLDGEVCLIPATISAAVDLRNPMARGIHMSRLYRLCDEHSGRAALDVVMLRSLLQAMLDSHADLSHQAHLAIEFTLPLRREALRSGLSGWRQYPVRIDAALSASQWQCNLETDVLYSSTCPGSAAMARQVVQQRFVDTFGAGQVDAAAVALWLASPEGVAATPHAQRSSARVRVALNSAGVAELPVVSLIDTIEAALKTPVQGAVKRIDEQEFARLNGENPMYCEDAARRIVAALDPLTWISDYAIEAAHLESLHPHDAVAHVVKRVPGGFQP
ncbi:GTP cyclohydrolase FolE2 [Xanthomonadaceae bacterium JHOS43]|nr:GTP cyclohydrolase FolE2 [Xanthomonadaceae bacterium JHOS43]MCX7563534.1 GTP cyclohydrolase FolE2 [Xanthomonadaceae bacterium XH05]